MLIKVFNYWINPVNITYITENEDGEAKVCFNAPFSGADSDGFDYIIFAGEGEDEVAAEINRQIKESQK